MSAETPNLRLFHCVKCPELLQSLDACPVSAFYLKPLDQNARNPQVYLDLVAMLGSVLYAYLDWIVTFMILYIIHKTSSKNWPPNKPITAIVFVVISYLGASLTDLLLRLLAHKKKVKRPYGSCLLDFNYPSFEVGVLFLFFSFGLMQPYLSKDAKTHLPGFRLVYLVFGALGIFSKLQLKNLTYSMVSFEKNNSLGGLWGSDEHSNHSNQYADKPISLSKGLFQEIW